MGKKRDKKIKKALKISYEKIILIGLLGLLLGIQIKALFLPKSEFEEAKERVLKKTNDFKAHLILAEELLKNNRLEETERELNTISNNQMRATSKLEELWQEKQENDPQDLEILTQRWQEILQQKPDYRDGWLKLSLYLIKVGKINEAQEALEKAKELDPNYEVIKEIENLIFSLRPV